MLKDVLENLVLIVRTKQEKNAPSLQLNYFLKLSEYVFV